MNICSILPIVLVQVALSYARRNGECYVPQALNGDLKEKVPRFHRMNWTTFNFERTLSDENVPVGSVRPRGAELFLFCHDGYFVQEMEKSETSIMCINGKWSPNPVCFKNGDPYSSSTEQASFSTSNSASEDECSCEYTLDDIHILAHTDGKLVRLHDRIKNGSILTFRCSKVGYHQLVGVQEIQCENCQFQNTGDFPTCMPPEIGDAMIFLDNTVNVSLEGVLKVQKENTLHLVCSIMEIDEYPTWNVPNVAGINLTEEIVTRNKDEYFLSHLNIEKVIPEDAGLYTCTPNKEGRPATVQVEVVETL